MLELTGIHYDASDGQGHRKQILRGIDLCVPKDSFVVITGPNGGGKSTLAKLIMGIEQPTAGRIAFLGEDITDMDITQRARLGIGFAFQQPVRFKGLTVRNLLDYACGRALSTQEACDYLSKVGLCAVDYIDRELNASLSGGEMKRIEIAMLMARNVQLSIFDEPEAGIDLWSFHNLVSVFERLRRETQGAVMIISHQERILDIADRIVVVADGEITAQGPKDEILPGLLADSTNCAFFTRRA